ncbi:MAG: crossover junction endodeoxyribonuclease RuvC [Candidatus Melainabacteria bacterium]|nr:crossover junction endodeoxyribonuclease RuvC [Candidatus Melainabacteria bacterium]
MLGIDPGTAKAGYGVLDCLNKTFFQHIACGVITTPKELPMGERLAIIRNDLISLIDEHKPHVVAVESIFFFKNAKTLVPVAQARGVILEVAASFGLATFEYTPMQVKLTLAGFGQADKKLVQFSVAKLLNETHIIKPDDAADAMAIAICHARMSV